jgi:hypothetical protein
MAFDCMQVMTLLFDRITEETVKAVVEEVGLMKLLPEELRGDDIPIAGAMVKVAAGNGLYGNKIMTLLLDRRGDDIPITEEAIKPAAGD